MGVGVGVAVGVGDGVGVGVGDGVGVGLGVVVGLGVGLAVGGTVCVPSGLKTGRLESTEVDGELPSPAATAVDRVARLLGDGSPPRSIDEIAARTMIARPATKTSASQSNRPPDRVRLSKVEPRTTPVRRAPPAQRGFGLVMGSAGYSRNDEGQRAAYSVIRHVDVADHHRDGHSLVCVGARAAPGR